MSETPAVLALDLGTSALKALVVGPDGRIIAAGRYPYPTAHPQPGFAEQDPHAWWRAVVAASAELSARADISAIAVTGQMHGTVLLDEGRQPLAPAIIWADSRSSAAAARLTASIGAERLYALAGSPLAPGFQAATLAWLREHRPELWRRLGGVVLPKDWLAFRLTGRLVTEPSDAAGTLLLDSERRTWAVPVLAALGLDPTQLPSIVPSGTAIGTLTATAARELGLPAATTVVLAGGDAPCGAVAAGATGPDHVLVLLSTGAQVIQAAPTYAADRSGRLHVWPAALPGEPRWNRMGAILSAGLAVEWLRTTAGIDSARAVLDLAAAVPAGAQGLLFLPYLIGERTPLMDPAARGALFGLDESHGPAALARAVVEGIAFTLHEAMAAVTAGATPPTTILLGGGGARHPLWSRLLADALGLPVRTLAVADLSTFGAAMLAAHHLGWIDLPDEAPGWHRTTGAAEPDPARHGLYRSRFEIARELHRLTRPLVGNLADLTPTPLGPQ